MTTSIGNIPGTTLNLTGGYVVLTADPTVGPGAAYQPGTIGVFGGVYYWKWGTGATDWALQSIQHYTLALAADPRTGAGQAAPVGTFGVFGGVTYSKWGTGNTEWRGFTLDHRQAGVLRAQTLLGTDILHEDFVALSANVLPYPLTAGVSGGATSTGGGVPGGQWLFETSAVAGRSSGYYVGGTQFPGNATDVKWYARSRFKLSQVVGAGCSVCPIGIWSGGTMRFCLGVNGSTYGGSETKFSLGVGGGGATPVSAVLSTVDVDTTAYHTAELLCLGTGAGSIRFAVDGEGLVSVPGVFGGAQWASYAQNGADAANYGMLMDYVQFIVGY